MNDKEFLLEAIGDIDDDLIDDAAFPKPKRKMWPLVTAAACTAAALLAFLLSGVIAQPDPVAPAKLQTAENLWLKDDFAAFSLSYAPMNGQTLSYTPDKYGVYFLNTDTTRLADGTPVLQTTPLVISGEQTLEFQALVGRRYIAYISEKGYPVFYDTQTDRLVDLQERILGDTNGIFLELMKNIEIRAQQDYPGFLNSDTNRRILWEYVYYMSRGLPVEDVRKQSPDTEFILFYDGHQSKNEERLTVFWEFCFDLYINTERTQQKLAYCIQVLGIDAVGGSCIIRVDDVYGSAQGYMCYNIVTDTCTPISDTSGMRRIYNTSGYEFSYSPDGSIAAAHFPKVNAYSENPLGDYIKRYEYPTYSRKISRYEGEEIRLYLLSDQNRAITVDGPYASSKVYYAEDSSVIYYRVMPEESKGRTGYFSDEVWYNRLNIVTSDSDQWAFYSLKEIDQVDRISDPIILQGNVVRLAADNTVAIMERGGKYYAYSLADGREVTQDIREDRVSMYLHEQYVCWLEDGILYRKNIFKDGQPEALGPADVFHMSDDGAFAFIYCGEDTFVTCVNVATLESCIISIDGQLAEQFLAAENAKIRMAYTDHDHTLLLSFCAEEEAPQAIDLYSLLQELPMVENFPVIPEDPVVNTDLKVADWVVEGYRNAAAQYDHASVYEQTIYSYYPAFAPRFTDGEDLFACLGLEKPETFAYLQGTRYILFENGSESLILEYYVGWGLFDYDHYLAGVRVLYRNGRQEYSFLYAPEFSKPVENPAIPDIDLPFDIPVEIPEPEEPYDQVVLPQIHEPGALYREPAENYGSAVFTEEALQALVLKISQEDADEILLYMEQFLDRKDYSPHAKQQIRDTVTQLMWYYPNYQTLFGFLDPLDTKAFICDVFLAKLDGYVDHICFPCDHGETSADHQNRTLHLPLTNEAETNAMNLIYLATLMPGNDSLRAGMAAVYAMTLIGSPQYSNLLSLTNGSSSMCREPNTDNRYLRYASGSILRGASNQYAKYYFRLYVLSDTETMLEYERTENAAVILDYLTEHYGSDGLRFYNEAMYTGFEDALEGEKLFLQLFLQRLEEVETQEEMLSYLQLYRIYRKLFCLVYQQREIEETSLGNQSNVLEMDHPELDYRGADALVADAACRSGIIQTGVLTQAQTMELLKSLIGRREYADYDDYRDHFLETCNDVFLIGDLRYKIRAFPGETVYKVTNYTYGYSYIISAPLCQEP